MPKFTIDIPKREIKSFCLKWKISEFALFGSILREDFNKKSDVDILVTFQPDVPWSLFDWIDMIDELKQVFGRDIDLIEKSGLRNPYRRKTILDTRKIVYERS